MPSRRRWRRSLAMVVLLAAYVACGSLRVLADERQTAKPPNLLFVIVDQMRGSAMGFLGEEPVVTPKLDRFARQAIVFTEAASNYPICSPFRAMWMTGQYPHRNGVINNCYSRAPYGVELKTPARCWSDVLAAAGYSLGYIGKWHLEAPRRPTSQLYLAVPCENPALGRRGVRTPAYTLVLERTLGKKETTTLYDNVADPYQLENIANARPEIVDRLTREELIPWLRRTADPWLGGESR